MCRLRTKLAHPIEHGAGIIQAIANIGRKRRTPQGRTHFIANGFDAIGKYT
jgi:hypothetical protein